MNSIHQHALSLFLCLICALVCPAGTLYAVEVTPLVETGACQSDSGDVCDDSAIWIHPNDPSQSVVIGDDKHGGIVTWNLDGSQLQYLDGSELMNNLDIRYNFPLTGTFSTGETHTRVALITVANESGGSLVFYKMNPSTRKLESAGSYKLSTSAPYGGCMYHSPVSNAYYFFVNWKSGIWQQIELKGGSSISGQVVRQHDAGSQTEGCVADDVHSYYYIQEENVNGSGVIWRYGAEPKDGTTRVQVSSDGDIVADGEGIAIYYRADGGGYIIVSAQGNSTFVVYERKPASGTAKNTKIGTFTMGANGGIDASSSTDGLDVTNFPLGTRFPKGMLVNHDGSNSGGSASNHKLTPFERIATALSLTTDTSWDPREVGQSPKSTGTTTPTPTIPTSSITGSSCALKAKGDATCDGNIDLIDFEVFRKEYTNQLSTRTADFDLNGTVAVNDFELWRKGYFGV